MPRLHPRPYARILERQPDPEMDWIVYVATPAARPASRAVQAFLDLLTERVPQPVTTQVFD